MKKSLILALALMCGACAASAREKTITATYVSLNAADAAYIAWNKKHEADLIAAAAPGQAEAALTNYKAQKAPVDTGFKLAYKTLIAAVQVNDDPSLKAALKAAADLMTDIAALGVKVGAP